MYLANLPTELLTQALSYLVLHDLHQVRLTLKLLKDCVSTQCTKQIYEHYPWASSIQHNARIGKDFFVIGMFQWWWIVTILTNSLAEHYSRLKAARPTGVYRFKKDQQWNLQEQTLVCVDINQNIYAVSLTDSRVLNISLLDRTVRDLNPYVLTIWSVPDGVVIQFQLRKTGSFMAIQLSYAEEKVWKLGPSLTLGLGSLAIGQDSVFELFYTKQVWKVIRCELDGGWGHQVHYWNSWLDVWRRW